ncbi:hypothetical protein D3C75_909900 [compost metagenome]
MQATPSLAPDQPALLQRAHPLAHSMSRDAELLRQFGFGRQRRAGRDPTAQDFFLQRPMHRLIGARDRQTLQLIWHLDSLCPTIQQ